MKAVPESVMHSINLISDMNKVAIFNHEIAAQNKDAAQWREEFNRIFVPEMNTPASTITEVL